jgi:hypothetical protein
VSESLLKGTHPLLQLLPLLYISILILHKFLQSHRQLRCIPTAAFEGVHSVVVVTKFVLQFPDALSERVNIPSHRVLFELIMRQLLQRGTFRSPVGVETDLLAEVLVVRVSFLAALVLFLFGTRLEARNVGGGEGGGWKGGGIGYQ